ncbi:N-acyl homoserine lactonase family protein [Ktedonosporobacter rubrisoli]|uniref:N-acyl homoserine lactonase family protein n=1 Tax=Ktedonosporobacter rubrisoli TaxID=2509675 RepID=A0A4P6JIY6_KTERU|nr:N-acyl homoserine lactonase family protein [Ktedonosporobacter rubrisoli]QBD75054.1 N-acyl homoserine lactonase family protein [Ktedonosporobacter rubrisoli]
MTKNVTAPQRLYLMLVGLIPGMNHPFVCYLVQTGDGKNILIDSGLPAHFEMPGMPKPQVEKDVLAQLAMLGLQPQDIDMLICTHFDVDHSGHHSAFTQAELIVQRKHYELARGGHQRFALTRAEWDHPELRYRLVEGDTELLPGLKLIETSGHVPGHQSVLVQLPQTGAVLLAIDAVAMQHDFQPDRKASPFDDNEEEVRTSTRKLLELAQSENAALVVFGHDAKQWQEIKKAPACFD